VQEDIDLIITEPKRRAGGISAAVVVSLVFHSFLIALFIRTYRNAATPEKVVPIARYVQLITRNPQDFVEAPGPKVHIAPLTAPLSDANRRAAMPKPTGEKPTLRPGDRNTLYTPSARASEVAATGAPEVSSKIPALRSEASMTGINWRSAIKEVGQVASIAGGQGLDLSGVEGGEKGTADTGPLSFETQWYDWGEYAQSMVSKIRVHWYNNMPMLIRTGMKGVVTIRFTIQRDGRITDITQLNSSGIPPYDFAARKAIELASPLNPLPKDFPNATERVTAMFYYNMEVPSRR
jgi:TonB family protein